jgi:hypothetical protein
MKRLGVYCVIALVLAISRPIGPVPSHAEFWEDFAGQFFGSLVLVAIIGGIIDAVNRRMKQRKAKKPN